jgi:hypothetical protein
VRPSGSVTRSATPSTAPSPNTGRCPRLHLPTDSRPNPRVPRRARPGRREPRRTTGPPSAFDRYRDWDVDDSVVPPADGPTPRLVRAYHACDGCLDFGPANRPRITYSAVDDVRQSD